MKKSKVRQHGRRKDDEKKPAKPRIVEERTETEKVYEEPESDQVDEESDEE